MILDDIDIANPDAYLGGVPHEQFALLRRKAPVFRHRETNGPGFWALTRHEDIVRVSRDADTFRQAPALFIEDLPAGNLRDSPDVMINMDPPRHTRFRALVSKGFTPRIIQRLERHVRAVATALIDAFATRGSADFVAEFASELPMRMILELVGVPREEQPAVLDFSTRFFGALDPEYEGGPQDLDALIREIEAVAHRLAEQRRRDPRDDMLSQLVSAEVEGQKLSDTEIGGFFRLLLSAGHDTTKKSARPLCVARSRMTDALASKWLGLSERRNFDNAQWSQRLDRAWRATPRHLTALRVPDSPVHHLHPTEIVTFHVVDPALLDWISREYERAAG